MTYPQKTLLKRLEEVKATILHATNCGLTAANSEHYRKLEKIQAELEHALRVLALQPQISNNAKLKAS